MQRRARIYRTVAAGVALGIASELGMVGAGVFWAGSVETIGAPGRAEINGFTVTFVRQETALVSTLWIDEMPISYILTDTDPSALPRWSFAWNRPDDPGATIFSTEQLIELAYGWPWRSAHALMGRYSSSPDSATNPSMISGVRLTSREIDTPKYRVWLYRALPTSPICTGLVADVAVFTLAWSALIFGLGAVRRWNRRRRGRCVACAYDLRATPPNLPCPECGRSAGSR